MKYPKSWPGVICMECRTIVELTEPRAIIYVNGDNGYTGNDAVEYVGWDPEHGMEHGALEPIPLTEAAREMLAIVRGR